MVSLISRKLLPFSKIEGDSRRSLTRHLHQSSYVKIMVTMYLWTIQARYYHDTPEYRDRVSLLKEDGPGRYMRNHFKPDWVKQQLKTPLEEDTAVSKEWKHKVANELVDRHPSNYPLYGVEKYVTRKCCTVIGLTTIIFTY